METDRIRIWRYKYLKKIKEYRDSGYMIVYLDETWFDSHETVKRVWSDDSKETRLKGPVSKGKQIVICHAITACGLVENALLLCGKKLSESYADYHDDMNGEIFEKWFRSSLMPNLPKDRNVVIVMDNAKYHNRLVARNPSMGMKKAEIIAFMEKNGIPIPTHVPTKPVLLEKIKAKSIPSQYKVDLIANEFGFEVLRLPPYHCVLNPIEMAWNQMKVHARKMNVFTSERCAASKWVIPTWATVGAVEVAQGITR